MKQALKVLLFGCIAIMLAATSGYGASKPTLHVYTWADYIKPELVQRFEKEHYCKVVIE